MTLEISLEPALEALLCQKAAEQGQDLNKIVTDLITHALQNKSESESVGIVRTERGLTIQGTRITLYDVMDYLTTGYDNETIRKMLSLTQTQWDAAQTYIAAHHTNIIGEYHQVLEQAEENRRYWETRNQKRLAYREPVRSEQGMTAAHKKLQAWQNRLNAQ
ncbi:hypothetical protein Lepto7375DRAFT_0292 [Leptolyngbya sp. PCC 7375]|nr:hypothetical protein Lepto7375DRAFT_0292 [Leptolyngbya sp. PCC 7375]